MKKDEQMEMMLILKYGSLEIARGIWWRNWDHHLVELTPEEEEYIDALIFLKFE